MRSSKFILLPVLALPLLLACREAPSQTTSSTSNPSRPAQARVQLDERNDYLAGVRREQLDVRADIHRKIDAIDDELAAVDVELRGGTYAASKVVKDGAKVEALVRRRAALVADVAAVESAPPETWEVVKARVEKNLASG